MGIKVQPPHRSLMQIIPRDTRTTNARINTSSRASQTDCTHSTPSTGFNNLAGSQRPISPFSNPAAITPLGLSGSLT
jgi:hypothetical protein